MAETKVIPFTLDDRDRIIRTEQKIEALDEKLSAKLDAKVDGLRAEMNARFETVNKQFAAIDQRFDQLFNFLWAFIGIFTAMMASVFGFAFWDRKLSLDPIKKENLKTLNVLRAMAEHQPKVREILKNAGLM
jgi:ABC-type phosphate transport system auxiliary subunit